MKIKFLGTEACPDEITIRDVTFPKGEGVVVEDEYTAAKCLALPYFEQVKPGRKRKNGENIH